LSERDELLRHALAATFEGDRENARRLFRHMLAMNPADVAALEGLRRLDAPPRNDPLAPAPPADLAASLLGEAVADRSRRLEPVRRVGRRAQAPESGTPAPAAPPTTGVATQPQSSALPMPAAVPVEHRRSRWWWLLALLLLMLLTAYATCDRQARPAATSKSPGADPRAASPTPDLVAAGTMIGGTSRKEWTLPAPYKITPSFAVSALRSVLKANPDVAIATVGDVSVARDGDAVRVTGADLPQITDEGLLVLASAIWRYTEQNGRVPRNLDELVPRHLDEIPLEAVSGKANESPRRDGTGGWVYRPPTSGGDVWAGIAGGLQPNGEPGAGRSEATFVPITVTVHKASRTLEVWSGTRKLRSYKVGVGASDATPEGEFRIDQRSALAEKLPDGRPNPFGTRWLRLTVGNNNEAFGIHGTDQPASVGAALSRGCLRVERGDLEDLYQLVPTGTPVTIDNR